MHDRHQLSSPCTVRFILCSAPGPCGQRPADRPSTQQASCLHIGSAQLLCCSHAPTATPGPHLSLARLCLQLACCSYCLLHTSGLSSHAWQVPSRLQPTVAAYPSSLSPVTKSMMDTHASMRAQLQRANLSCQLAHVKLASSPATPFTSSSRQPLGLAMHSALQLFHPCWQWRPLAL